MKIGILYICTGKYTVFWKDFYLSCERNFISEADKEYFVFTDSPELEFEKENKNVHRIYQENLGWPDNTLMRFDMFSKVREKFADLDYIFFFNADLVCLEKITAADFLPGSNENLVAVLHPGYFDKKRSKFPYETKKISSASIDTSSGKYYFAGGLNGGKTSFFLQAILEMKKNIELDKKNGIVAKWHDESHWNKYLEKRTDVKILHSGYLYPEASAIPFKKMILVRDKRKYFSYQVAGKKESGFSINSFKKVKTAIENIGFIQRSLIWQLMKRWINRLNLLRTIYRNDKKNAIKIYLKNDYEYAKIKREIDSFKVGNRYDFGGVKLPLSVITADTFLNVLKPAVEKVKYETTEIEKFYVEQKNKYKTLVYWKDNYLDREPDYIGGHIISHGFTYFFKEIDIDKDDVVVDLGAAPGDFSAVCIQKGASQVYAFEPEENNSSDLGKVRILNGNKIEIVRKYCGAETNELTNTISLDDFARKSNITKIDFIKSDIEGAEAKALIGAKNILKTQKPKLAFCTYHSMNDERDIEKAILDGNPNYKIYKEKGVLYAY